MSIQFDSVNKQQQKTPIRTTNAHLIQFMNGPRGMKTKEWHLKKNLLLLLLLLHKLHRIFQIINWAIPPGWRRIFHSKRHRCKHNLIHKSGSIIVQIGPVIASNDWQCKIWTQKKNRAQTEDTTSRWNTCGAGKEKVQLLRTKFLLNTAASLGAVPNFVQYQQQQQWSRKITSYLKNEFPISILHRWRPTSYCWNWPSKKSLKYTPKPLERTDR